MHLQSAMSVCGGKDRSTPENKGDQRHAKLEIQWLEVWNAAWTQREPSEETEET